MSALNTLAEEQLWSLGHMPAASASPVSALYICIFGEMPCAPSLQPCTPASADKPCTKALKVAQHCAGAFSVGVPERFVGNYIASQSFVGRLEAMCGDARALGAFRGSAAYQSWQGRWKLSVYYGLCFQVNDIGIDYGVCFDKTIGYWHTVPCY